MKRKMIFAVFICFLALSYSKANAQCSPQSSNLAFCSTDVVSAAGQTYYISSGIPIDLSVYIVSNPPAPNWSTVGVEVECGSFFWVTGSSVPETRIESKTITASENTDGELGLWVVAISGSYGEITATW